MGCLGPVWLVDHIARQPMLLNPVLLARLSRLTNERPRLADSMAFLAGAALVLAFAPFELRLFAVIAPAVLFVLWTLAETRGRAARYGFWFGFGQFGVGISWVYVSIHDFGQAPPALAVLITLLFVLVLAAVPAVLGGALARPWRERDTLFLGVVVPAGWLLAEWVRGWFFTGFPWLALGYAHIDTWLGGYAPVLGVYGVTLLSAILSGWLAVLLLADRLWWAVLVLALLGVLLFGGYACRQVNWTQPVGSPLDVALVQGNLPQLAKWEPAHRDQFFAHYRDLTLAAAPADLVVWPESALPAFYHEAAPLLFEVAASVRARGGELMTGVLYYDFYSQRLFNSLLVPGGAVPARYDKRHLVPFGEYVPFGLLGTLEQFLTVTAFNASPGHGRNLMHVGETPIGAAVCYEVLFGEEVIDALPEAVLLVNVSNDAWFGESIGPKQHLEIARMRSLETARPLLRATNNGITAVIRADGRVADRLPQFTTAVLYASVQPRTGVTPYAVVGNWPAVGLALALLLIVRASRRGVTR